jgi:hypothetical protein
MASDVATVNARRTDEDGIIEFITDGERLWVRMKRQAEFARH